MHSVPKTTGKLCLLLLLLMSSFALMSTSAAQQSTFSVSSYGTISSSLWRVSKTVTWADGTTDTLVVTTDGRVLLNGVNKIAFGFHWTLLDVPYATGVKVLNKMQQWGIRFISFDLSSWFSMTQLQTYINTWFPEFYARKMFVEYAMQERNPVDSGGVAGDLNTTRQTDAFTKMVHLIATSSNPALYGSMIYAATYAWEFDNSVFGHTASDNLNYVAVMTPIIKSLLQNSLIGNVPLMTKIVSPWGPGLPLFQYCDIVGYDYYVRNTASEPWQSYTTARFSDYRYYCNSAGKTGYKIWLQENGVQPDSGGNSVYDPAWFEYVLSGAGQNDLSELMIWVAIWDTPLNNPYVFQAFSPTGDPYQWVLNLVPYFPV